MLQNRTLTIGDTQIKFGNADKKRVPVKKAAYEGKVAKINAASIAGTLVAKPGDELPAKVEEAEQLVERSFGKTQETEVFFPCRDFGQFYLEESTDGIPKAIGCYELTGWVRSNSGYTKR
jgi:hypothetical protein